MKRAATILAVALLAGCSNQSETAAGIEEFIKACDGPVRGAMLLSSLSNSLTLQCDRFKPVATGAKP